MTDEQYKQLVDDYGEPAAKRMVEILDNYKGSKGKTYKDDYKAIKSWVVDRYKEEQSKKPKAVPTGSYPPTQTAWEEAYTLLHVKKVREPQFSHVFISRAVKNTGWSNIIENGDAAQSKFVEQYNLIVREANGT